MAQINVLSSLSNVLERFFSLIENAKQNLVKYQMEGRIRYWCVFNVLCLQFLINNAPRSNILFQAQSSNYQQKIQIGMEEVVHERPRGNGGKKSKYSERDKLW